MQNMPILKFEKSCNYLTEQLDVQNNNKQLILDIISNIGLLSDEKNSNQYENILEEANIFLKRISSNITKIEQLHLEIQNITKELSSILSNQGTKTKEFYIAAFSNIKHTVIEHSEKFQEIQNILSIDNNEFNEFINDNNFKYNFAVIDENTNSYTFTGFSINTPSEDFYANTNIEISIPNQEEINEVENIIQESVEHDFTTTTEDNITDETENIIVENNIENETTNVIVENNIEDETENIIENNVENEAENEIHESSNDFSETSSKIDELTNEFRELLIHLSESNIPVTNVTTSLTSMFSTILSPSNESIENSQDELINNVLEEESIDNDLLNEALLEDALLEDVLSEEALIEETNYNDSLSEINNSESSENTTYESIENDSDIDNENFNKFNIDASAIFHQFMLEKFKNDFEKSTQQLLNNFSIENEIDTLDDTSIENEFDNEINSLDDTSIENEINNDIDTLDDTSIKTEFDNDIDTLDNTSIESEIDNDIDTLDDTSIENEINNDIDTLDDTSIESEIDNEVDVLNDTFIEDESDITNEDEGINESIVNNIVENVLNIFIEPKQEISETITNDESSTTSNTYYHMNDMEESIFDEYSSFEPARPVINYFKEPEKFIEVDTPFTSSKNSHSTSSIDYVDTTLIKDIDDNYSINDNLDIIEDSIINTEEDIEISIEDIDTNFIEETIFEELNKDSQLETNDILPQTKNTIKEKNELLDSLLHSDSEDSSKNKNLTKNDFESKLKKIQEATEDNKTLLISEKLQKIYLPYKLSELVNYVESYPGAYKSLKDVVEQEFILPFNYFKKNPSKSRFTETYNLLKNREGRTFIKSVSYAFRLLKKNNLNPAIIASCKSQHELDSYIYYLDSNSLNNFKFFDIIYEVNPM